MKRIKIDRIKEGDRIGFIANGSERGWIELTIYDGKKYILRTTDEMTKRNCWSNGSYWKNDSSTLSEVLRFLNNVLRGKTYIFDSDKELLAWLAK